MSESKTVDTPPQPEEVLADERIQYQAMTDLSDEEYHRLTKDICENGMVNQVVVDDSDEMRILDGHHREAIHEYHDLTKSEHAGYTVLGGRDETEKLTRAIKQNILGRDSTEAVKSHAVEQYIEVAWETTDDGELIRPETDNEVAEKLGVSNDLVGKVVKNYNGIIIYHDRVEVQEYYEDNPDASYREVARQVDASRPTVTEWLKEDFDEGDDDDDTGDEEYEQQKINAQAASKEKAADAAKLSQKSQELAEDGGPDEVKDAVEKKTSELESGETSPDEAVKDIEKTEEKSNDKRRREEQREEFTETVKRGDGYEIRHGDFSEVLSDGDTDLDVDHIITDPPYDEDALEQWENLASVASDILPEGGYLIAYSGQTYLPRVYDILTSELEYIWQLIVKHESSQKHPHHSIGIHYKPVFVFGNETKSYRGPLINDVIDIGQMEKEEHEWQQPVMEAKKLSEKFTEPNDVILDPMCGSGTTGVAALSSDRRTVCIDNDVDAIETTEKRIREVVSDES